MTAIQERVESGLSHKTFNKVGLLLKSSEERVPVTTSRTRPDLILLLFCLHACMCVHACVCVLQTTHSTMSIEKWVFIVLH